MAIIKKFRIKSFKQKKSILKLQNMSLSFQKRQILENISFEINQGEIFGMLGPNGVGKSTIFNLITGLVKPDSGEIFIKDEKVNDYPIFLRTAKFKIGYVPQYGGYFYDLTLYEKQNIFLEGTGSLVLDRVNKTVYMAESNRSNVSLASKWSQLRGYDLVHFKSYIDKKPSYHTNVMMFITDKFAGICFDSISDSKHLLSNIKKTHKILNLSIEQVRNFSGNAIVVKNITNEEKFLISSSGLKALDLIQIKFIERYYDIVEVNIPTIEKIGGGSVRCMLLELF